MTFEVAPGALIDDRFEIERFVEQGGMGAVYRAVDRTEMRPVALKFLRHEGAVEPISAARFAREAKLLAALDHPRVVRYVGHGQTSDGRLYLAMQWLEGHSLKAALARGVLSLNDSLLVLSAAAEGLSAVHSHGVVHRDLKPGTKAPRRRLRCRTALLQRARARSRCGSAWSWRR
jgi:serine/threonine protein kinase